MPARLHEHTFARVDHHHCQVSSRSASEHIAGILLVPRAIRDDEFALFSGEEAVGNVDSDALFALRSKTIDQQGKIDFLTLCAHAFGIGLQCLQLIFKDHFAVVQQAPNQGRFAVVHRAAGNEAQ